MKYKITIILHYVKKNKRTRRGLELVCGAGGSNFEIPPLLVRMRLIIFGNLEDQAI